PSTTELTTLSLHDALPICGRAGEPEHALQLEREVRLAEEEQGQAGVRQRPPLALGPGAVGLLAVEQRAGAHRVPIEAVEARQPEDRKSTRLNSSHVAISYA